MEIKTVLFVIMSYVLTVALLLALCACGTQEQELGPEETASHAEELYIPEAEVSVL